jgi:cyanate permease
MEAVTVPIGLSTLDLWRTGLLALLVMMSLALLFWTRRIADEYAQSQAEQRLQRMSLYRAQQEKLAAPTDPLADA